MAGKKKKEEEVDAARDFSGEEAEWFIDDEAREAAAALPAPPAPPAPPGATPAPAAESSAPTVMFSLDQLPDIPVPDEERAETLTGFPAMGAIAGADAAKGGGAEAEPLRAEPTDDTELGPRSQTPVAALPSSVATLRPTPYDALGSSLDLADQPTVDAPATEDLFGEMVDVPSEALVRTPSRAPRAEPAPPARPPLAPFQPGSEIDDWRAGVSLLEGEAVLDPSNRGAWLAHAGLLAIRRAGDGHAAETLLSEAVRLGRADAASWRVLEEVSASSGRWEAALGHAERRAYLTTGVAAADAWYETALLARHQLGRPPAALGYLEKAVAADGEHFAAQSLRRDLLVEAFDAVGDGQAADAGDLVQRLAEAHATMAGLSDGWLAAEAWSEQAELLVSQGRGDEARASFERAVTASPSWGPAEAGLEIALLAAGDHAALAEIYHREAEAGGPDASWWSLHEARARGENGEPEAARTAFQRAFAAGDPSALREWEAWARSRGDAPGALEALEAQAGAGDPWSRWRLAAALEAAGRETEALAAYEACLAADGSAWPAEEAIFRLLRQSGEHARLRAASLARAAAAQGDEARALAVVVGELAAEAGDVAGATAAWVPLLEGGDLPALVAAADLSRFYRKVGDAEALATVARRRAGWEPDPRRANDHRWIAATGAGPVDLAIATDILVTDPAHPGALDRVVAEGGEVAARAFEAAVPGSDPLVGAALSYQAARAWSRLGRLEEARGAARAIGLAHPLVELLVEELDVDRQARWRARAEATADPAARAWAWFAAGSPADLERLAAADPGHAGAFAAQEVALLASADAGARIAFYQANIATRPDAERAALGLRLAAELALAGRHEEAGDALAGLERLDAQTVPARVAAMLAEGVGHGALAARLLAGLSDPPTQLERGRVLDRAVGDSAAALAVYRQVLSSATTPALTLDAALGVARTALAVGDRPGWIHGHTAVAHASTRPPKQAAYAGWAAAWLEEEGRIEEALPLARRALEGRPGSEDAFETLLRILQQRGDGAAIRALFETYRPGDPTRVADALEAAGDAAGQLEVLTVAWEGATEPVTLLPLIVRLEVVHARAGDWQRAYELLTSRRELTRDEGSRAYLDARRRWLLAEKLADSQQAWDLYRQLHLDAPADRDVTLALARIAGARGDHPLAVQYLRELADSAGTPAEAARCQRLVAAASEATGDASAARQAYLDALDHVPDDAEAMEGLKRLARASDDWNGLIAVLQREAGLADDARRLEIRGEIARVSEQRGGDPGLAIDAWRDVLELAPRDREALDRLFTLAGDAGQWGTLVEAGSLRADLVDPSEQGALLELLGDVATQHLDPSDGLRFYERAVESTPPSLAAARKLERLYRSGSDWRGVGRVLELLAGREPEAADRTDAFARLARMELDVRRDRDAAAAWYQRAFALDPTHEVSLRFLAAWVIDTGRLGEALPVYEALEAKIEDGQDLEDPDTRLEVSTYWFQFGELLRAAGRIDEAIPRYERALALSPAHQLALEALGSVWVAKGEWRSAGKAFSQLLQVTGGQGERSKVANAYTQLGLVERALGSAEKADKRFQKALEVFPNHVGALKGTGRLAEDRGDWNALMSIFNAVIVHATVPGDVVEAYMTKGRVLDEHLGRSDKAAQHYQRSLDFDPNQPTALLRLAEIAVRSEEWPQVAALADRALRLDPTPELERCRPALLLLYAFAEARQGMPGTGRAEEAAEADARFAVSLDDAEAVRAAVRHVW